MTTLRNSLASASAVMLLVWASAAHGQARERGRGAVDSTMVQRPCGDYYGSEYGYDCTPPRFEGIGRHVCAYRTGPPCPSRVSPAGR
jgi:hypothetical protein